MIHSPSVELLNEELRPQLEKWKMIRSINGLLPHIYWRCEKPGLVAVVDLWIEREQVRWVDGEPDVPEDPIVLGGILVRTPGPASRDADARGIVYDLFPEPKGSLCSVAMKCSEIVAAIFETMMLTFYAPNLPALGMPTGIIEVHLSGIFEKHRIG
jgi:hypothetical protein